MLCGTLAEVEPYNQKSPFMMPYGQFQLNVNKRHRHKWKTDFIEKLVNQTVYSEGVIDLFDLLEKPQPQIKLAFQEFYKL